MSHKKLTIGLFGFGVVGEGLYQVLQLTPSLNCRIKKICIKDPGKVRNAPSDLFTTEKDVLLNDPEINVIVEVINESEAAYRIVTQALKSGRHVISASKKMIAEHLEELLNMQQQTNCSFLYEAAACASIPVIRNLEEYYDNDLLRSLQAVVNGSTNFILDCMFRQGLGFKQSLLLAQQQGFAEKNPDLDVLGYDALYKWQILLLHAFGILGNAENIISNGIQDIRKSDADKALAVRQTIKLIAQAKKLENGKIAAFVLPQFLSETSHLSVVSEENNGIVIESSFADKQLFLGKGAGSFPTAAAILSDLAALRYQYKYEYKKRIHQDPGQLSDDYFLRVYLSFDSWDHIPKNRFERIDEWFSGEDRCFLSGLIHAKELINNCWWKENNISLILLPDPVVEHTGVHHLKKKSLELAGLMN